MTNIQILVVEDEGIIAKDIQNMLNSLGYAVPAVASSGGSITGFLIEFEFIIEKFIEKWKKVLDICFSHLYSRMRNHYTGRVVICNRYPRRYSAGEDLDLMS